RAKLRAHSLDRGIELRFVGHVAGIAARLLDLAFERVQSLSAPGEHRNRVAPAGESAGHRGSGAWAYAGDQRDGTVLFHQLLLSVRLSRGHWPFPPAAANLASTKQDGDERSRSRLRRGRRRYVRHALPRTLP